MQVVKVKHGPEGDTSKITVFWDDGSTCSLVKNETAEILGCPNDPITVSIETVDVVNMRQTKLY